MVGPMVGLYSLHFVDSSRPTDQIVTIILNCHLQMNHEQGQACCYCTPRQLLVLPRDLVYSFVALEASTRMTLRVYLVF